MRTAVRILVVDDDASALGKLSKLLRGAGHDVLEAGSGAEGLKLAFSQRPELAILDVMLPDLSGFEVCRRIKEQAGLADTFVVLMSGAATRGGGKGSGLDECADAYMLKSADGEEFLARVRTFVRLQATSAALRASERNYRELAENIREVFWISDLNKEQVLYVSPGYEQIWGRTCESLYASPRKWLTTIHPDDRERVRGAALTKQVSGQYHEVYRIQRPDGSVRWIEDRAFPIRDEAGNVARIAGIADDITERKRAEMRSQAFSEMRHRLSLAQTREEVAEIMFEVGSEFFGWEAGYVSLCTPGQDKLIPLLTVDMVENERKRYSPASALVELSPLMRRVLQQGAEIMNPGKAAALGLALVPFGNVNRRAASMMFAPIHASGAVIGLVSVQSYSAGAYTHEDLLLLQSLADLCGGALHRLEMNEALRLAEARYRGIFEHATEGIFQTTHDGHYLSANPALARMFGYQSPEELIAAVSNIEQQTFVSATTARELKALLAAQDSVLGFEAERYRKDRSTFWTSINVVRISDGEGRLLCYEGTAHDVTERKHLEKRLVAFMHLGHRLSAASAVEEAAQIILEIAQDLFGWDSAFVHLYSETEERIVRVLTMDTIGGRRVSTPPSQRAAEPSPMMRRVMREGPQLINRGASAEPVEGLYTFGDATRRSSSLMFAPIRTGPGVVGILSVQSYAANAYAAADLQLLQVMADHCGDALERIRVAEALREAEAVLRESERKLRLISENATDAIFAFDMARRPVYTNSAVAWLTGYTSAEIQERGFINWFHPDDQEQMLQLWEDLYAGKSYSEVEFKLITKGGQTKWCSSTWGPLFDETGRQIGVQGRERDVTQRKQLETEILEISTTERRRMGHELHDGLGQYLAGISFRAKALEQQLLTAGMPQYEEAKELVTLMVQAIGQTRNLARGLAPVDIEASGLAAALQNLAAETSRVFKNACQVWCSEPDLQVDAQVGRELFRISQEAIHNALEHGEAERIDIKLQVDHQGLLLQIIDDGKGFDLADSADTGMGLRVMGYRARSIGGNLKVSSKPGKGTQVSCVVPIAGKNGGKKGESRGAV